MIVRPGIAKSRLCPMQGQALQANACLGEVCMAWRTAGAGGGDGGAGFCGMAGKPSQVVLTEMVAAGRMARDVLDEKSAGGGA